MRFLSEKRQVLPVSVRGCNTVQLLRRGIDLQRGTDGQLMLVVIQPYADANTEQFYATRGTEEFRAILNSHQSSRRRRVHSGTVFAVDEFAQSQIETGGRVDLPNRFHLS